MIKIILIIAHLLSIFVTFIMSLYNLSNGKDTLFIANVIVLSTQVLLLAMYILCLVLLNEKND